MKNPLIPMASITGNPTKEEICVMLRRYADKGIQQFLLYPRDGCEVPYMSSRWIEICRDIIETAAELDIDIWLYDEYNWPSGTCHGAVMEKKEEFFAHYVVFSEDGSYQLKKTDFYADILNPEAVDCFLNLTHEVYYAHFGKYFGSVIKGIFTDEPAFLYFNFWSRWDYPYTKDIEKEYQQITGRDLFTDMSHPTENFDEIYYTLLEKRFRQVFIDKINTWCLEHKLLFTGHLMDEAVLTDSVLSSGNGIAALRGFSLPGIDEIFTYTTLEKAEWLTLGTAQAAIRTGRHGGLVETFALGPTDLPPARIEQMIWLEAMFQIDHYVLAVSAMDARGNVIKSDYFNPMNYINPWFEGYPELGASALEAAVMAQKEIRADVCVRIPYRLAKRSCRHKDESRMTLSHCLNTLLRLLTQAQYQWILLDEEETAPKAVPVIEISDDPLFSPEAIVERLKKSHPRRLQVFDEQGRHPRDFLLREFTDGSAVLLDLSDSAATRSFVLLNHDLGTRQSFLLCGRGHCIIHTGHSSCLPQPYETLEVPKPVFRLLPDRPNTLRCNIRSDQTSFTFRVTERLDNIRMLIRAYQYDGSVMLDGLLLQAEAPKQPANTGIQALICGLAELYRATAPFSLMPGDHTVTVSAPAQSEPFFPSCFLCGTFADRVIDGVDTLYQLPQSIGCRRLNAPTGEEILPQYAGKLTFETTVTLPHSNDGHPVFLSLDCGGQYTRVFVNGLCLGGRLQEFVWELPARYLGHTAVIRIEQFTSIAPIFGRAQDVISSSEQNQGLLEWFPHHYHRCGIEAFRFVK